MLSFFSATWYHLIMWHVFASRGRILVWIALLWNILIRRMWKGMATSHHSITWLSAHYHRSHVSTAHAGRWWATVLRSWIVAWIRHPGSTLRRIHLCILIASSTHRWPTDFWRRRDASLVIAWRRYLVWLLLLGYIRVYCLSV